MIKYTEAGTHTYTVRELNQTDSTINYDTHEETITVVVTDDGEGNLSTDYDSDFSFTFENTTKPGSILLTKQRVNRDTDNFTFNVRLTKDNAPYTGDVLVGETTVTPDENGMFSVEVTDTLEITNIPAGVEYEITEEEKHGWTNTEAIGDTGTIVANWQSGVEFTNEYHASGMARLVAHKSLIGDTLNAGDYTFTLTEGDSTNVIQTKTNTAPDMNETDADENPNPYYGTGAVIFDDIYYDESDIGKTYTYFIHEVTGDDDTVIYDNHIATATVTVTDSGEGYLNTEVTYNGEVFTNEKKTGSLQLDKFIQKQGQDEAINSGEYSFEFTIKLFDASGKELTDTYMATLSDGTTLNVQSGVPVTFNSNKVLTIDGLPHGATYSIEESESPGWECINEDNTNGDIVANSIAHASFTNVYSAMGEISLTAKKRVEGMDTPGGGVQEAMPQFEFIVVDENDNQVSIATNDENGNISLPLYFNMDDNGKEYTYYIKEKVGNISDIIYDDNSFPVVVRVNDNGAGEMVAEVEYQDDTRIFTNRRVTTLDVTKTVNGNMGDKSKPFTFTANLKGENITYMKVNDNGVFERGEATEEFTFTLGHGERIHFENLTFGEEYSIVEEELVDYEQTSENASGVQEGQTASFVNTKSSTVPTRVTAPGNPYWIIPLIAGGIAIAVVIGKKRKKVS